MMLTRNLLYTAVTRAEQACVIVAQPAALAHGAAPPRRAAALHAARAARPRRLTPLSDGRARR